LHDFIVHRPHLVFVNLTAERLPTTKAIRHLIVEQVKQVSHRSHDFYCCLDTRWLRLYVEPLLDSRGLMLDWYRRDYADFNAACMREQYLFLSGQKPHLEIAPVYERYSDLFARDAIDRLQQHLADAPPHFETERAALRRLLTFAVEQFLENEVKELTEAISDQEAATRIEWRGRELTFQDTVVAMAGERDRNARRDLYQKRLKVIAIANDLRAARLTKLHEQARALGHESYTALFEALHQRNYAELAREAASVLTHTEAVYTTQLGDALKRDLAVHLDEAERADCAYFTHLRSYDEQFPTAKLLSVYRETMAGLGITIESQTNIHIDKVNRPRKTSRAFCMPVLVPDEIKLVIRPIGGQSDYQALLHESGHAQHYGWTSAALLPEFKYAGDYALTETYAFLFDHLISDSAWLKEFLGFTDNQNFLRAVALARLAVVRRYVAKLIYESQLHASDDLAGAADLYAELQTSATRFQTSATEYLSDLDDGFYAASYVRAWALEVQLREYLRTRFGQRWWDARRAGNFLKEIWETGDRFTADEMAAQIGIGPIAFDLLIDEFNQLLR
jgi:hypothetical protein